jgi:hypothetical protein
MINPSDKQLDGLFLAPSMVAVCPHFGMHIYAVPQEIQDSIVVTEPMRGVNWRCS